MGKKARVIAYYLPQFHPIPENDEWWGKGFTEWTNVGKANPLFKGHNQPRVPADLGYYDLRLPEIREQQAELARNAGIEGFCYYHYWFGKGKQLLERPFNEVLDSGKPDFPFCLCWANHDWTDKIWSDSGLTVESEKTLIKQEYSEDDNVKHFYHLLPAFKDKRYIKIEGKPCFVIWHPHDIPNCSSFINLWQQLAKENGLGGIYFIANQPTLSYLDLQNLPLSQIIKRNINLAYDKFEKVLALGFDGINSKGDYRAEYYVRSNWMILKRKIYNLVFRKYTIIRSKQKDINKYLYTEEDTQNNVYPTLLPNWDHSPRSGKRRQIYVDSTPEVFKEQIKKALSLIKDRDSEHRVLFLRSWNEWGEGNYVEPDLQYGHGYLDVLRETIIDDKD